ncbi:hypothetical protein GWK47_015900 [Chionoecetes opilio]|uniref:Uncharacterized protein n=1 Tax=Chionoecetes opilio TaxID=41210 RepID=A0A8J4XSY2_CHIOP|nr:hypothetical protein GWK47_015900 [Chionoecetes opilio]
MLHLTRTTSRQDPRVVDQRQHFQQATPSNARVPQGSVLWHLLGMSISMTSSRLIPGPQAYDETWPSPCDRRDWQGHGFIVPPHQPAQNWTTSSPGVGEAGQLWPPDKKTRPLLYLPRQDIANCLAPDIRLEGRSLPLQRPFSILGVEFDAGDLTFQQSCQESC